MKSKQTPGRRTEHLLLLPYCGKPSKKHFVELSAYLIKCNMDMSEHTWQRLTYWAAVLPVLAQLSVYTRTLTRTHTHTHARSLPQLVSNVKFDINKCLHNDNNNLRNCRGQFGVVSGPSRHSPYPHIASCLAYKACLSNWGRILFVIFFAVFAILIVILHNKLPVVS